MTAVGMTPRGPAVAEEVRDLQSCTGHVGPLRWRLVLLLRGQWREPVQRAHDLTDDVGGHMGVARRGVELCANKTREFMPPGSQLSQLKNAFV